MSEWDEWAGNDWRKDITEPVRVRLRNGFEDTQDRPAYFWRTIGGRNNWKHRGGSHDITEYLPSHPLSNIEKVEA